MQEEKVFVTNKLEEVKQPMDELQIDLTSYEELDPIESPACIIGSYFVVSD
jgi:hypothetical protein